MEKINFDLKKLFAGRVGRKHFILGQLFSAAVFYLLIFVAMLVGKVTIDAISGVLFIIFIVCQLVFAISLDIRRLHDLDKKGWWLFFCLVPIANLVLAIFLIFVKGTEGPNRFGAPIAKEAKFFDVLIGNV